MGDTEKRMDGVALPPEAKEPPGRKRYAKPVLFPLGTLAEQTTFVNPGISDLDAGSGVVG